MSGDKTKEVMQLRFDMLDTPPQPAARTLTQSSSAKYLLRVDRSNPLHKFYTNATRSFWRAEEIDFSKDMYDFQDKINDNERHFITHVLAGFAIMDGPVNENIVVHFYREIEIPIIRAYYTAQMLAETIHAQTYALQVDVLFQHDPAARDKVFNAVESMPVIAQKMNWALKWMESGAPLSHRIVAFAAVEGVFFSGSFCAIDWFKKRGIFKHGICKANEWISRDEGQHCDMACFINKHAHELGIPGWTDCPESTAHDIIRSAISIEVQFITVSLPVGLIGINAESMIQYIKFCADRLLYELGYAKLYNATNPFDWMQNRSLEGKTNFFEERVSEYSKPDAADPTKTFKFTIDEDF
jgi:ribonucleoside-diphosphate reductase beta chain